MSRSIAIDEMAGAIEKELIEYRELAADELKTAVKKAGKTAKSDINKSAPVRTGKYAKSWRMKVVEESSVGIGVTVYSSSRYMLAHLLENGHALKGGGRSKSYPHIGEGEKEGEKVLLELIERKLK